MSKDTHSVLVLRERPCDSETEYDKDISAQHETEIDSCLLKNCKLTDSCNSQNNAPAVSQQLEHNVLFEGNSKTSTTPQAQDQTDGGWGWLIVVGTFFITFLLGGMNISFSMLYLEFVESFDASRAAVGWIGSLYFFMTNVIGTNNSCLLLVKF